MSRPTVKVGFQVTEQKFYEIFWNLVNLNKPKEERITDRGIELLSIICSKPIDYNIYAGKNLNGKSKKIELAKEMGVKPPWLYEMLKIVIDKGFMGIDEDNFYVFPKSINQLRKDLKQYIELNPEPELDYIIRFAINNDDTNQGQDRKHNQKGSSTKEQNSKVSSVGQEQLPAVEAGVEN